MKLLQSEWLIRMLKKSGKSPDIRMLNLFNILDDWLDAPQINTAPYTESDTESHILQDYLTLEAAKAGAKMPEMLANQLYFMAISATKEKLEHHNTQSFTHARSAAKAMITAQTKREFHIPKNVAYASVASLAIMVFAVSIFVSNILTKNTPAQTSYAKASNASILPSFASSLETSGMKPIASATQTAALIAKIEQMRKGNCQLIEAIQLPDAYKKVYFENIVLGQISTDVNDQRLVNELLPMVKCNYTPMLMANSRN
jgi:hypothetical protein